jgi:trimeric autotransporter adhesin
MKMKICYILVLIPFIFIAVSCNENSVEQYDINKSNSLILYLPFNGNANDESGKGNNATTVSASLTADRFGKTDSAYSFNGSSSYIQIPTSISLVSPESGITMCAWININSWYSGGWAPVFTKSNTSHYGMYTMMILEDDQLEIELNSTRVYYPYTFQLNTWYFIVFSWDGLQGKYYVNGNYVGSSNLSGLINLDSKPLMIGKDTPEVTEYLNGKLDDIRIYNYAVSDSVINNLYHENGWK